MVSIKFPLVALLYVIHVAAVPSFSSGYESNCPPYPVPATLQRQLFTSFVDLLYVRKNVTAAHETYVATNYINHNPFIPDGRDAAITALLPLVPIADIEILHKLFDMGIGAVHMKVTFPGQGPEAFVDIFRFNGSCIVEHWDVEEAVPKNATSEHPLF